MEGLPRTEVVILPLGDRSLEIEQVAGLETLAKESLRTGSDPYWAYLWPSARALATLIATAPDLEGKRVLDLGCGPGACGLAAALRGARVVLADIRPEAIALAEQNAARNALSVETRIVDWSHPPEDLGRFDGIVAADVLYDDGMLAGVVRFLRTHLEPDGVAWITDPMRVMPGGVAGAARLNGLDTHTEVLLAGQSVTGGVTLYELTPRVPRRP